MGLITVELELSTEEEKLFNEYLDAHCLDGEKWLRRAAYNCLHQAVGKWKQPVGKIAGAFKKQQAAKPERRAK